MIWDDEQQYKPPFGYTAEDIKNIYVPPNGEEALLWLSGKRFEAIKTYSKRTNIKDIKLCTWLFFSANDQYVTIKKFMDLVLSGKSIEEILEQY